jgi:hypothetical protein
VNQAAAVVAVAAVLGAAACEKKQDQVLAIDRVETASPGAVAPEPRPIAELIAAAQRRGGAMLPSRIQIEYVGADGTMDPAYARLETTFAPSAATKPGDDPNRRTGAPVPKAPAPKVTQCPRVTWREGHWETKRSGCSGTGTRPTCSPQMIWAKALVQGAPQDAVAKLTYDGALNKTEPIGSWRFDIVDEVRDVSFHKTFPDDCAGMVEAPDPTVPPDEPVPGSLDRQMIANGIGAVKAKVQACARGDVHGAVRVKVKVTPAGTADVVTVVQTPDPELGACVAAAVRSARFAKTGSGGSFSYPFVF